ncbi:MAG: hypothetical protein AMS27_00025 [Bacteroides sp. SM23_62_1]|nr:MAG: hypothetical protein AMS27_00025 [Bacteroides sp. SM23_62_1]
MITFFWSIFFFNSCVPIAKFHELEDKNKKIDAEREKFLEQSEVLSVDNAEMNSKISLLEEELEALETKTEETKKSYDKLSDDYADLTRRYEDLQQTQEAIITGHSRETRRLLTELQGTQEELQLKEDRLKELEQNVGDRMRDLEKLRSELNERNQRLIEMESIMYAKDSLMRTLKNTIAEALYGFQQDGLSVSVRNGKVYVSMEEKLLFKTGSIEVDPRGVSALRKLAPILENTPDIFITVEGHTDDVPVRSNPSYHDNWDLSVKRATSIVRILLDNSSIDPERFIASGRGEYLPVDSSNTPEARQKNRRTEIILTPDLDELYQLLESD